MIQIDKNNSVCYPEFKDFIIRNWSRIKICPFGPLITIWIDRAVSGFTVFDWNKITLHAIPALIFYGCIPFLCILFPFAGSEKMEWTHIAVQVFTITFFNLASFPSNALSAKVPDCLASVHLCNPEAVFISNDCFKSFDMVVAIFHFVHCYPPFKGHPCLAVLHDSGCPALPKK